jgi:hypothetical protein
MVDKVIPGIMAESFLQLCPSALSLWAGEESVRPYDEGEHFITSQLWSQLIPFTAMWDLSCVIGRIVFYQERKEPKVPLQLPSVAGLDWRGQC